jgi:hypothetical protein
MTEPTNAELAAILRCILGARWRGDAPLEGRDFRYCVRLAAKEEISEAKIEPATRPILGSPSKGAHALAKAALKAAAAFEAAAKEVSGGAA